jgi:hypothetical protein
MKNEDGLHSPSRVCDRRGERLWTGCGRETSTAAIFEGRRRGRIRGEGWKKKLDHSDVLRNPTYLWLIYFETRYLETYLDK